MSMVAMTAVTPFRVVAGDARADAAREDGYLYLPGLLPADDVLAVREAVTAVAARHGLLRRGSPARDGIAEQSAFMHESVATPAYRACYNDLLRLRDVHALAVRQESIGVLETVLGESVLAVVPGSHRSGLLDIRTDDRLSSPSLASTAASRSAHQAGHAELRAFARFPGGRTLAPPRSPPLRTMINHGKSW